MGSLVKNVYSFVIYQSGENYGVSAVHQAGTDANVFCTS